MLRPNSFAVALKLNNDEIELLPDTPDENGDVFDTVEPIAAAVLDPLKILGFAAPFPNVGAALKVGKLSQKYSAFEVLILLQYQIIQY